MELMNTNSVEVNNITQTGNGDRAYKSTMNANLDLFASAGAMRNRPDAAVALFCKALEEDDLVAIRCMFYLRDIRGGQGERELFRRMYASIPGYELKIKLMKFIAEYGRWDDIFEIALAPRYYADFLRDQLDRDMALVNANKTCSLLAKWMPSENASSADSRNLARELMAEFRWTPRRYRKTLSAIRKHLSLLEQKMSTNAWDTVVYNKLPGQAFKKHTKAFKRHDETRFADFCGAVERGEKKVNAGTVFPYEIYEMCDKYQHAEAEALWKSLPNYCGNKNAIVVADVSGSMTGRPMAVSVSLALYFAERNRGPFGGYFMTFDTDSRMMKVEGNSLAEKMSYTRRAPWGGSTNVEAAFKSILAFAKTTGAKSDEIPQTIYIVSDMQFNSCCTCTSKTMLQRMKAEYATAGYKLPTVVFWNVNASDNQPATIADENTTLISGCSPSTFRYAVEGKSPMESMWDILMKSERYKQITI